MPALNRLDPQERNVHPITGVPGYGSETSPEPLCVAFRHSGWSADRQRVRAGLARSDVPSSRLDQWDACGSGAWVLRDPDNPARYRIAASKCKDRFCVPCADDRSAKIGRRIRDKIDGRAISFLTLTLRDSGIPLTDLINKLLTSFRKLRQSARWKETVAGGVAFIEIKWNADKRRWHPHLHAIMQAGYLPKEWISERWRSITAGSFIVDIKRPRCTDDVIRYVTRYGSKPLNHSFVADPARLDEAIAALSGRHFAIVFGAWRGWCLIDDDEHEQWQRVDTLDSIIRRSSRGDPDAIAIMEALQCTIPRMTTTTTEERAPPRLVAPMSSCLRNALATACDAVAACRLTLLAS